MTDEQGSITILNMNKNSGHNQTPSTAPLAATLGRNQTAASPNGTTSLSNSGQLLHWQEVLLHLNQKISDPHINIQDRLQHLTRTTARQLKAQRASIWRLNPLPGKVECLDFYNGHCGHHNTQWALQSDAIPYYINALVSDELLIINDAVKDQRTQLFYHAYLRPYNVRALMVIPIHYDGGLRGLFCLERTHSHDAWTEPQQLFAAAIALSTSLVMANDSFDEQRRLLRRTNSRLEHLMRKIPVAVIETNVDGDCFAANEYWSLITGVKREKAHGRGWLNAVHPDDRVRVISEWNDAIRSGNDFNLRFRLQSTEGDITWVQGQAEISEYSDDHSFLCILHDLGPADATN